MVVLIVRKDPLGRVSVVLRPSKAPNQFPDDDALTPTL